MQLSELDGGTLLDSLHRVLSHAHAIAQTLEVNFLGIARTNFLRVLSSFIRIIILCFIKIQILGPYPKPESESLEVEPRNLLREILMFLLYSPELENHYPKSSKSLHRHKWHRLGWRSQWENGIVSLPAPLPPSPPVEERALKAEASKQSYHRGPVGLMLPLNQKQAFVTIGVNLIYHFLAGIKV